MGDLTDLATVRQAIPRLSAVADAEIARLISEASDIISSYCNRTFGPATFTEKYNVGVESQIFTQQRPIASIVSITVGLPLAPTVLDPSVYTYDAVTGEIRGVANTGWFYNAWPLTYFNTQSLGYGWQSAEVVYTVAAAIPAAISGRCLAILSRIASGLNNDTNVKAKTVGDASITYVDVRMTLTLDDISILSRYKIWSLGGSS